VCQVMRVAQTERPVRALRRVGADLGGEQNPGRIGQAGTGNGVGLLRTYLWSKALELNTPEGSTLKQHSGNVVMWR